MVELNELLSINISPLVTVPSAVNWSKDNHISVLTLHGISVFELTPSPLCSEPNLKLSRTFIYPSDIVPAKDYITEIQNVLLDMEKDELYSVLMNESLTPNASGTAPIIPKIIKLSWSPPCLFEVSNCLLAIVTNTGNIEILFKKLNNWYSLVDISNTWLNEIKRETEANMKLSVEQRVKDVELFNIISRLQGVAITWSELHTLDAIPYAYLITAYRSSDIVVWKIPWIKQAQTITPSIAWKMKFKTDVKIETLLWSALDDDKYVLVIGYFDGHVDGVILYEENGFLKTGGMHNYITDVDLLSVTNILLGNRTENCIKLYVTKHTVFFVLKIDKSGALLSTDCIQTEGFSITSLTVLSSDEVLLAAQDSSLQLIHVKENDLSIERIKHNFSSTRTQYLGLCSSYNHQLQALLTSPESLYDHLAQREPSTLYFFSLRGTKWDPLRTLQENPENSLLNYWDCLELIRITAIKASDPTVELANPFGSLEVQSVYQLRVSMWLSAIMEGLKRKTILREPHIVVGEISEAQPLIFINFACAHLMKLKNKQSLSKEQLLCVKLLRTYLHTFLSKKEDDHSLLLEEARKTLNMTSDIDLAETELCNLCGEVTSKYSWNTMKCPSGHKLPRCALTLLQITSVQYRSCPICGQIFHSSLDEEYEKLKCPFCDVAVVYDKRVRELMNCDTAFYRNLSKKPTVNTDPIQCDDPEMLNSEDLKRQTAQSSQSIIVRNNRDEPNDITEIWREL